MYDIWTSTNLAYIENCEIIIFILIRIKFRLQQMSVHIIRTTIVLFKFEFLSDIHNISLSDKDYFFELVSTVNFSIYAHVVDLNIKAILVRNENIHWIKIFKNFRLSVFNEMSYSNAYVVDFDASDLAIKSFKKEHKDAWFNKISVTFVSTSDLSSNIVHNDVTLKNDVTIHQSSDQTMQDFANVINNYFNFWIDQEFANLFMNNWIRILLKLDWKKIIKKKVKVYFLSIKNKILIDITFDKLQKNK